MKPAKLRPLLSILAYGGVFPSVLKSVMRDLPGDDLDWTFSVAGEDAAVDRARSIIAGKFLETDCDVLIMVDHDMGWCAGDLSLLACQTHQTRGVVGALVSKKAVGQGIGGRLPPGLDINPTTEPLVRLGEDFYVGGALMGIHRSVFESLLPDFPVVSAGFRPFFMPLMKKRRNSEEWDYLSEDWAICELARQKGHSVHASTRLTSVHYGTAAYTLETAFPPPASEDS